MNAKTLSLVPAVLAGLLAFAGASAQIVEPDVWVLLGGSGEIAMIDPNNNNNVDPNRIDVSDADGDRVLDPPNDLCFSTLPNEPGTKAFVTQGRWVTVVDVATEAKLFSKDIGSFVPTGITELRGCASAAPYEAVDPASGLPTIETDLFVAGTSTTGDALWFALDQTALLDTGVVNPVRDHGVLAPAAMGGYTTGLELRYGAGARRALFTATRSTGGSDEVLGVTIVGGPFVGDTWSILSTRTYTLPAGSLPPHIRPGAPFGRELPAVPAGGKLHNTLTEGLCDLGGNLSAVEIVGPGPDSYSVFVLESGADTIHVVEPVDCTNNPISVGDEPVALAALGNAPWRALFIAEKSGNTVSRLDPDGTVTPIALGSGAPIAAGIPSMPVCMPGYDYDQAIRDLDDDGFEDDVEIIFDLDGCPILEDVRIWCRPKGLNPNPDCFCDCSTPPNPEECMCPPLLAEQGGDSGGGVKALDDDDDIIKDSPWIKLGTSAGGTYHHIDGGDGDSAEYGVSLNDDPPD